jgi:O-antigen/teichoic acid export membrane protein
MTAEMPALAAPMLLRQFVTGIGWATAATVGERAMGLVQSILIAHSLGIEDFGRYGLLFVTVGWIGSVAGLQLGLTATVEVARHRDSDSVRAHAVVRLSEIITLAVVIIAAAVICSHPEQFGAALLGRSEYAGVMYAGGFMVVVGVLTGIQDCVLQGYEDFKALAVLRTTGAAAGLLLVVVAGRSGGLGAIVLALALASAVRFVMVLVIKELRLRRHAVRLSWRQIWAVRDVLWSFSFPSVLISAIGGSATWYGMMLISRSSFSDVALVTAGQQWRGSALLASNILSSVSIPLLTRAFAASDIHTFNRLQRLNTWANVLTALSVVLAVSAVSNNILSSYGSEFRQGRLTFLVLLLSAIPAAHINGIHQTLIGSRSMWLILGLNVFQFGSLILAYFACLPDFGSLGFAAVTLAATSLYSLFLQLRYGDPEFATPRCK